MSLKWTGNHSESGILRKSDFKEKKEELFVFGYSCKLFRDDDKALHIDQGKHLIPWMGDETLKIDRYDARGALHDLTALEAPPGGFDWRVELTRNELDVEQLCDEERYRALHTDEDEEEMYKEEELKRLHAAGYGQVGFNYDAPAQPTPAAEPAEVDEPFVPTPAFKALLPIDIVLPESLKQNAIIEKTAKFIAAQGVQMEILIKAKQGDNPQFRFLNKETSLHPYYTALIGLVKSGKWPEKKVEVVEEKPHENEDYLHPSLASTIIESAPAIPSIHYKPSADCDYTLLINKMRGDGEGGAAGDVPPPGTEPAAPPAHIYRPPVIYAQRPAATHDASQSAPPQYQQYAAYYQQHMTSQPPSLVTPHKPAAKAPPATSLTSTGLSLMKNYNTDSDSDVSDFDDSSSADSKHKPAIITPPEDVQIVIDKMAAYVARNGDEFADIVRAKNDPRFTFLEPDNMYHAFYKRLMNQKRGLGVNGGRKCKSSGETSSPVSFSIKKLKEPDPILPKPALPYESSSDEDTETTDKQTDKQEDKEPPKIQPQLYPINNIPPVVVYKIDGQLTKDLPTVTTIEPIKHVCLVQPIVKPEEPPEPEEKPEETSVVEPEIKIKPVVEVKEVVAEKEEEKQKESPKRVSPHRREDSYNRDSPYKRESKRDKRKHRDRKKGSSKSESRDRRSERRSAEREKRRQKENDRDKKRRKYSKEELENEIISLVDNSDDLIDLTGDQSDTKGECEPEAERAKQRERRRRAADFLRQVGVDPAAATALPATSLASAMVDTLESIRKKKAEDEEKRRRRDKRRHRDRREYDDESHGKSKRRKYRSSDDDDESDYESSKKKKRKKDKKPSSKNKKRRRRQTDEEEDEVPVNIDLTNTLKELRTSSPTTDALQDIDNFGRQASCDEELRDRKKKREYSEGEWSSDSEADSRSTTSLKED